MKIDTVIFDLDGVIRDWNDDAMTAIEISHGITAGSILATGFGEDLGPLVVTGQITYREWMDAIRDTLIVEFGPSCTGALDIWEQNVGTVNDSMLAVLRATRTHCRVALLSNGTTRLREDLDRLDLSNEFDEVFNTAELGVAKPTPEVFNLVLDRLGVGADQVLFIDDLEHNVAGAGIVGIPAHLHTDSRSTIQFLRDRGVPMNFS